jgi:hypothetical protein
MAIEFKNNLDINQNQLLDPVIELQDTDVNAGTGTQGQLYFNTTDQVLKVWNTTGGASWKSISGDITEVTSTTTSQLVVTNQTGPVASLAIQLGSIANGQLNLVTSDVIYDYIETLDPVLSVTGGLGIALTGTSDDVTVNVAYSGSDNVVLDASDGTAVGLATDDKIIFSDTSDSVVKYANLSQLNTSSFHPTLAQVLAKGNTTGGTDLAVSAGDDITFTSTSKAIFNSQLEIYGDGSNSYIDEVGTGDLYIKSNKVRLQSTTGENLMFATENSGVFIYFNNAKKFETTTDGVKITGGIQDVNSSLGSSGQYLTSTGTAIDWVTLPTYDNYDYWTATDDGGNTYNVESTNTFDFDAGAGITAVVGTGTVVITNTDLGSSQTFFKTITCDTSSIAATANNDTAIIQGTAGQMETTGSSKTITIAYPAAGTVLPTGSTVATSPASGDDSTKIATTAFVQAAMTGLLEFKGGFNANTGDLDAPLSGDLYTDVAIAVGDYYVVTTNGNFFGNASTPLTTGDSVIVQTAKSGGNAAEADFIIVQSDTDLATASTVGIGNVVPQTGAVTNYIPNSITAAYNAGTATLGVREASATQAGGQIVAASTPLVATYTGSGASRTVTLTYDTSANPNTASVDLDGGESYISRAYNAGITTWAVTVTDAAVFGGGSGITTSAEVMTAAGQTVYCDVTRSGATITFAFTGDISNSTYTALLTRIS